MTPIQHGNIRQSISRIESIMALRAAETERHCERDSAAPYAVEGVDIDRVRTQDVAW